MTSTNSAGWTVSVAALLLVIGKFVLDSQVMTFARIIALLGAAVWRLPINHRYLPRSVRDLKNLKDEVSTGSGSDRVTLHVSPRLLNLGPGRYRSRY